MNLECNHCYSQDYRVLRNYQEIGNGVSVVECKKCGHYYSLIKEEVDYSESYESDKYVLQDNRGSIFDRLIGLNNALIARVISLFESKRKPRLLDFGSGKGQFLSIFKTKNWAVKGVETSLPRADFASKIYGLDISTKMYEEGVLGDGEFDVITLFHVLEHLPRPKKLLKQLLSDNLSPGGLVVVEVPLLNSWQSKIAGPNWIHLDPPLHLSHYNKKTLTDLYDFLQLQPIRYSYFSLPLGVLGMCQAIMSLFSYQGSLIEDLKFNRSFKLLMDLFLVLPFAFVLEMMAVIFNKGGVIRCYGKYKPEKE